MSLRPHRSTVGFIEPCQPIGVPKPPSGAGCLHEIKLDGFRLMALRRGVGGRLLTRNGNDWTDCYRLVADERAGRRCRRRAANLLTCVLL
jgi:bifunctional non-homologous end joining protein LigD